MKRKIIAITLGVLLVASIGCNVYQFTRNKTISVEAVSLQTDIDSLNENISSLNNEKVAKGEEISALTEKVKDLEEKVSTLQSDNESLSVQLEEQIKLIEEAKTPETPAPTETPVEETPAPTEEPSTTEQEKTDFAKSLGEADIEFCRDELGLSETEINQLTQEKFKEAVYKWMHSDNNSSGTSSGSSDTSSNNGGSSSTGSEDAHDPSRVPQLVPDDEVVPGHM